MNNKEINHVKPWRGRVLPTEASARTVSWEKTSVGGCVQRGELKKRSLERQPGPIRAGLCRPQQ